MKKFTFLTVIFLLVFSLSVIAQHRIGVAGGINFANIKGEGEYKSRTFIGIGGIVDLNLSEKFGLRFEPMYLQKGATQTDSDPVGKVKLSYLETPIFLKVDFGSGIKPYIIAGPTIGFLLSSEIEFELGGEEFKGDLKPVSKSIDLGFGFGAGLEIPVGTCSVFLESRYTFGLSDFNKG